MTAVFHIIKKWLFIFSGVVFGGFSFFKLLFLALSTFALLFSSKRKGLKAVYYGGKGKNQFPCTMSAGVGFVGFADFGNSFKQKRNLNI